MERLFGRTVHLVEPGALRNPYVREKSEETQVQVYAA
jgi:predicted nucleotidyltransferase